MRQLFYPLIFTLLFLVALSAHAQVKNGIPGPIELQREPCPVIKVEAVDHVCPGAPVTFKVQVSGLAPNTKLSYEWNISVGKIESGQGTDTITIESAEISGQTVEATVKVKGLDFFCNNTASQETIVYLCCLPRLFDQYGNIPFKDEKERLANFALQLQSEPELYGYIIAYGGRVSYEGQARERAERARTYLTSNSNLLSDRIVIIDGGYREDLTVELWILPPDTPPTPSPTVRPEDVQIIAKPAPRRRRNR
jgi:hypothetical protein